MNHVIDTFMTRFASWSFSFGPFDDCDGFGGEMYANDGRQSDGHIVSKEKIFVN